MSAVAGSAGLDPRRLEEATRTRARELLELARSEHRRLTTLNGWTSRIIGWCLRDVDTRVRILRFIDALPALTDPASLVRHLRETFPSDDHRLPVPLRLASGAAGYGLAGARPVAYAVRGMAAQVARQFIAAESPAGAPAVQDRLAARGFRASLDILGEDVLSEPEADAYADAYAALACRLAGGPHAQISVKASALAPRFEPPGIADALARAGPRLDRILSAARSSGVEVVLDAETYAMRDLTLELAARAAGRHDLAPGIAVQACLRDTEPVALGFLERVRRPGRSVPVRLVKGAYWDHEIAVAAQADRDAPVFEHKWETDAAFERLTGLLLESGPGVRPAIASHNIRTVAHAMARADGLGLPRDAVEFQVLYGMGDALAAAIRALGWPVRIYAPIGPLLPGMGYLVRRLLENTANESFLRLDALDVLTPDDAARPPGPAVPPAGRNGARPRRDDAESRPGFAGPPFTDFADPARRAAFDRALDAERHRLGEALPLLIGDREPAGTGSCVSANPAHPAQIVARAAVAGPADVDRAVTAACDALPGWRARGFAGRAAVIGRAADLLAADRDRLAALEVLEVGRTRAEADADVVEAIAHLRYAAARAADLVAGPALDRRPGESNRGRYEPLGPAAVIAPWNFPLAIPAGMAGPALVAGNPVLLKPSSHAPATAHRLVRALRAAGVPAGAVAYLPGAGEETGAALARHPDVPLLMFTGSRETGLALLAAIRDRVPGQRYLKQAVVELGGKNAIVVDDDADLDAAIAGILASAFGYAGQKCSACSRVIAVGAALEPLLRRLGPAADALRVDDPALAATDVGPLISSGARDRLAHAADAARQRGRVVHERPAGRLPAEGWYAGPVIVTDLPASDPVARDELFGPLLCVSGAPTFAAALEEALDSDFALTGGVYSRSPAHLAQAEDRFTVGNLYLNRGITGAIVGRQPFGGWRMSGLGTQAGGPDYLRRLVRPRTICENTARHGMPLEPGER